MRNAECRMAVPDSTPALTIDARSAIPHSTFRTPHCLTSQRIHSGQQPDLRDVDTRGPRDREQDGLGHVPRLEHRAALGESRPRIGVDRVPDRGVYRARRDDRCADASAAQLGPQHLVHAAQPKFARGVGGRARERHVVGDGADGDEGELPGEGGWGRVAHPGPRPLYTSRRNSSRVFASWSSAPRRALVIVLEFCFSTPRIIIQRWYASITTPTPRGSSTSMSASATWPVSRSCTWSRRANTSITRGILERPTKRPFGR